MIVYDKKQYLKVLRRKTEEETQRLQSHYCKKESLTEQLQDIETELKELSDIINSKTEAKRQSGGSEKKEIAAKIQLLNEQKKEKEKEKKQILRNMSALELEQNYIEYLHTEFKTVYQEFIKNKNIDSLRKYQQFFVELFVECLSFNKKLEMYSSEPQKCELLQQYIDKLLEDQRKVLLFIYNPRRDEKINDFNEHHFFIIKSYRRLYYLQFLKKFESRDYTIKEEHEIDNIKYDMWTDHILPYAQNLISEKTTSFMGMESRESREDLLGICSVLFFHALPFQEIKKKDRDKLQRKSKDDDSAKRLFGRKTPKFYDPLIAAPTYYFQQNWIPFIHQFLHQNSQHLTDNQSRTIRAIRNAEMEIITEHAAAMKDSAEIRSLSYNERINLIVAKTSLSTNIVEQHYALAHSIRQQNLDDMYNVSSPILPPDEALIQKEKIHQITKALEETLTKEEIEMLFMRHNIDGIILNDKTEHIPESLKYEYVAQVLNIPTSGPNSIRKRCNLAMQKLQNNAVLRKIASATYGSDKIDADSTNINLIDHSKTESGMMEIPDFDIYQEELADKNTHEFGTIISDEEEPDPSSDSLTYAEVTLLMNSIRKTASRVTVAKNRSKKN